MYQNQQVFLKSLPALPEGFIESKILIHELRFPLSGGNGEPFKVKIWLDVHGQYSAICNKYANSNSLADMLKGTKSSNLNDTIQKALKLIEGYQECGTTPFEHY